jgi:hypothetical protein
MPPQLVLTKCQCMSLKGRNCVIELYVPCCFCCCYCNTTFYFWNGKLNARVKNKSLSEELKLSMHSIIRL